LFAATLLAAATGASLAATPAYLTLDHSSAVLIDKAGADAVWKQQFDGKLLHLAKLYPVGKWGFVSQVEGGFSADKACVVTARAMMLPRSGKNLVFKPFKSAMVFDSKAGVDQAGCQALAKAKLAEAIDAVTSSLVK
jgi:hypothetical protein